MFPRYLITMFPVSRLTNVHLSCHRSGEKKREMHTRVQFPWKTYRNKKPKNLLAIVFVIVPSCYLTKIGQ